MKLLKEIIRTQGLPTEGRTMLREAVRGIIFNEAKFLLIHSTKNGDYKFPGGGVNGSESHSEALTREVREECGALVTRIGPAFGKMIEYDDPLDCNYEIFKMSSYYYLCQVEPRLIAQQLDDYEIDLGYKPVWVDIDRALQNNQEIARSTCPEGFSKTRTEIRWISREIYVMEQIRERLFHHLALDATQD